MKSLPIRRWDWLSATLLFFMMQAATTRLVITQWTDFLLFAQALGTMGIILGLAFGYSQFKRRTVIFLALGYSIVLIPWQLSLAIHQDVLFSERLASIGGRLYFSLVQFFQREVVEDGLLFVAFISILIWFIGLVSGYAWNRHQNYLVAVLPGGLFTLIIHLYDQAITRRILLVGVYILLALVLLGYLYYKKNREAWHERRVFQMADSAFDVTRGMAVAAAIFVFVAWTIPASQAGIDSATRIWRTFTEPWRDIQDWFSNAVEVLDASSPASRAGDMYGSRLSLGTGNPLSDTVIFSVEVPNLPEKQPRYYWRGYVYDLYQNNRWTVATPIEIEFSPANTELFLPDIGGRRVGEFVVQTRISQSLLYTATQPIWVSRPGLVKYSPTGEGEQDLYAWHTKPGLLPGEQYHVIAALTNPSIQVLQKAGTDYPDWVIERYLQLPEEFSPRIRDLAIEITQGLETPYEKADAITRYLRSEIEYVNPLPEAPPEGEDPLEWFLFEAKQGFCNYYASAEVLMLRSLGIPTRMAVGFAEGSFDNDVNAYVVHNMDAHAWPEVYFPDIGWVEFEPTVNQDPLVRPDRPEEDETENSTGLPRDTFDPLGRDPNEAFLERKLDIDQTDGENTAGLPGGNPIINLVIYTGAVAILIISVWLINRRFAVIEQIPVRLQNAYERNGGRAPAWLKNWARWTALSPIERSFETVNRSLRLLGDTPTLHATPAERAELLTERLPAAAEAIETLSEQHEASLFTSEQGNVSRARRASLSIWLYTIQNRIHRLFNNNPDK